MFNYFLRRSENNVPSLACSVVWEDNHCLIYENDQQDATV
jgi:hypothetical protein